VLQATNQHEEHLVSAQQTINVAFQGERGAFGDEAVKAFFVSQLQSNPFRSFADVLRAVARGEVEAGLVPVENSQAGSINEVYDLLR
jgi:prephenate dehydratase